MTSVDRDGMVAALEEEWRELLALLDGLAPEDWGRPTDCPGWTVQDNVAHVIGTEALMEGRPAPEVEVGDVPHVRNDMGRFNEQWVVHYRGRPPAEVVADLRSVVAERRGGPAGPEQGPGGGAGATPRGGRAGHVRPVHAHPGDGHVVPRAGHPGGGGPARAPGGPGPRGRARRGRVGPRLRRGQARRPSRGHDGALRSDRTADGADRPRGGGPGPCR